jgi:hypothetical protein
MEDYLGWRIEEFMTHGIAESYKNWLATGGGQQIGVTNRGRSTISLTVDWRKRQSKRALLKSHISGGQKRLPCPRLHYLWNN